LRLDGTNQITYTENDARFGSIMSPPGGASSRSLHATHREGSFTVTQTTRVPKSNLQHQPRHPRNDQGWRREGILYRFDGREGNSKPLARRKNELITSVSSDIWDVTDARGEFLNICPATISITSNRARRTAPRRQDGQYRRVAMDGIEPEARRQPRHRLRLARDEFEAFPSRASIHRNQPYSESETTPIAPADQHEDEAAFDRKAAVRLQHGRNFNSTNSLPQPRSPR